MSDNFDADFLRVSKAIMRAIDDAIGAVGRTQMDHEVVILVTWGAGGITPVVQFPELRRVGQLS